MHLQSCITTVALALAVAVKADFQIYKVDGYDVLGAEWDGWQVFDGEPSCDDVNNQYRSLGNSADVSGTPGIRCKGCGDGATEDDITELEINGDDWGHYTIYKDRGYVLEPAGGGATAGSCTYDTGDDFTCTGAVTTSGKRAFKCTSALGGIRARGA
ncbi:hypothetical protein TI39_contig336g00002 [Zymoseptoria brevis]|uniref:Uncharacterized protein n=1 Tax=Zymoseptoria brevis TaxID=1047168 RepID=A0A0F4GSE6_9PEZI|nr:hypothetical protein TI39_contig336g00002 [Zymoseptoria brevis]